MYILILFLLLLSLLAVFQLVCAHWDAIKLLWLNHYKSYPERRIGCNWLSRTIQDAVFKLDKETYKLNYSTVATERVSIQSVSCCIISDPHIVKALEGACVNDVVSVTWDAKPRDTCEIGEYEEALRWGQCAAIDQLEDACHEIVDITDSFKVQWKSTKGEYMYLDYDGMIGADEAILVSIDYMGHADITQGIPPMACRSVYAGFYGDRLQFPPESPFVGSACGLKHRRVLHATVENTDVTPQLQMLCGPRLDFYASTNPLTYATLWFSLWVNGDIEHLGTVVIEDSHLDTHEL